MLEMNDVVYSVTGYQFNEMAKVFKHLAIDELDWPYAQAQVEFESLITAKLANHRRQISPVFEVVSGIPFSGKSSFIKSKRREFEGYLFISFDALMKELSFYQVLMKVDRALAFKKCELVARVIGYELLQRAVELGCHIIFEHSSTPTQHLALYEVIEKEYGYKLVINYIQCSLALAKQRAEQNNDSFRDGGRYTPTTYIDERFHALQTMMNHYKQHFLVKEVKQSEFAPH